MPEKRMTILDTYYPPAIRAMPVDPEVSYNGNLRKVLDRCFGTSDFYSFNLHKLDWDCQDVIANHSDLQARYLEENAFARDSKNLEQIALLQIEKHESSVLFCQDLSYLSLHALEKLRKSGVYLAGQCSCPFPDAEKVRMFQTLFTSFPHYLEKFKALGVKAHYNPLAFESRILRRIKPYTQRDIPILFVGGVGTPSHWKYGMEILDRIAIEFTEAQFYGYGYDSLTEDSPIRRAWKGEAWGLDMYKLYSRAKIVINRHGEVAEGFTNNMRTFEATGCGALLLTEESKNLGDLFMEGSEVLSYKNHSDLIARVADMVNRESVREEIASNGQLKTLMEHTYEKRMKFLSERLLEDME
jgi:hypothetical protein